MSPSLGLTSEWLGMRAITSACLKALCNRATHVVVHILPSNVNKRLAESSSRHAHSIVHQPQRRSEAIAYTGEATARRRVSLEHDERLAGLLSNLRGVDVLPDHVPAGAVIEELGDLGLGVDGVTETFVECGTVVVGIAALSSGWCIRASSEK